MKAATFLKKTKVLPYQQTRYLTSQELATIIKIYSGLHVNLFEFKYGQDDVERVYFLARMYQELAILCGYLKVPFSVNKGVYQVPNLWHDVRMLEISLYGLGKELNEWIKGEYFDTGNLKILVNKILISMSNACLVFDLRPEYVLTLYHEQKEVSIDDIKTIKLLKPNYKAPGRPSRADILDKQHGVKLEDLKVWKKWVPVKRKRKQEKVTPKPTPEQRRKMKIHRSIIEYVKKLKAEGKNCHGHSAQYK